MLAGRSLGSLAIMLQDVGGEFGRDVLVEDCERLRLVAEVALQQLVGRVGGERRFAGEEFVDHAAEAVDVGADVERLAADLLGRHVAVRALHFCFAAEEFAQAAGRLHGEVEVDEFDDVVVAEHEVVGLDVAMDPALCRASGRGRRRTR